MCPFSIIAKSVISLHPTVLSVLVLEIFLNPTSLLFIRELGELQFFNIGTVNSHLPFSQITEMKLNPYLKKKFFLHVSVIEALIFN